MSFLEHILEEKEKEIALRMHATPLEELELMIDQEPVRDFSQAISGRGKIIAEIKRRSPGTKGFRSSSILDELPVIYEKNGASALSVVTDTTNFGITLEEAKGFRGKIRLPMLIKDFFIDPYQIFAARAFHADAILLIARILSMEKLASLLALAGKLGMQVIVEVHSKIDIEKARAAGAKIIGINNRDLDSLNIDMETTRRLRPELPEGVRVVSESGISSHAEIESLTNVGVQAFLIGRALLNAQDPGKQLRELAGKD